MAYITLRDVQLAFGGPALLDGANFNLERGERVCLIGRNGEGKSTLLKLIEGSLLPDRGEIALQNGITISMLAQDVPMDSGKVADIVAEGAGEAAEVLKAYHEASDACVLGDMEACDRMGHLQHKLDLLDGWSLETKVNAILSKMGLDPEADLADLSGGRKRRVLLARALLTQPDVLLLDEPTNHLDAESVSWLERFLKDFAGTIVAITHDRYFLDNVAEWILELDRGYGYPYQGNYTEWLEQKNKRLEQEQKQEEAFAKALKQELEWVRKNQKGQQAKSKSRLQRFEELNSKEFQQRNETAEIYIPPGSRLGNKVIEVNNISKSFGDRLLYENLSFTVPPMAIVGIIGPNGAGKTTLFNMITGKDKPDTGTVEVGESVKVAYVGQVRDELDDKKTVWEEVSDGLDMITVGEYTTPSRAYIGRFNFKGQDQQKLVGSLSGGERNRLQLAKTLKQGANVLLLDEPSNDLDVETLRALEDAVEVFPGTVMVVSHDRWFLDRIATHILAFEDEGPIWFDGNYSEFEAYRKKQLGADAEPKRMKYKKIAK